MPPTTLTDRVNQAERTLAGVESRTEMILARLTELRATVDELRKLATPEQQALVQRHEHDLRQLRTDHELLKQQSHELKTNLGKWEKRAWMLAAGFLLALVPLGGVVIKIFIDLER